MGLNQLGSIDLGLLDDGLQDLGLPVPMQTFLWGQIAPYIRPKLGKLHETTCVQKYSFWLIHTVYIGLGINWALAIGTSRITTRDAALLHNRVKDLATLGAAETKLLYTLHWILLFAAEECADEDMDSHKRNVDPRVEISLKGEDKPIYVYKMSSFCKSKVDKPGGSMNSIQNDPKKNSNKTKGKK